MENQTKTKLTLNPEEVKYLTRGRSCEADSSTYCTDTD